MKNFITCLVCLLILSSCGRQETHFDHTKQSNAVALKHNNIVLYKYTDKDSFSYLIGMDEYGKFCDTISLRHYEPEILLKDFNNDGVNDILVIFNFSDNHIFYKYWMYLSDKEGSFIKPKIKYRDNESPFFDNRELVNYNMIIADTLIGFYHYYHTFSFYKINNTYIEPLIQLRRDSADFNLIAKWDNEVSDWGEFTHIHPIDKKWLTITKQYWDTFPVGEW